MCLVSLTANNFIIRSPVVDTENYCATTSAKEKSKYIRRKFVWLPARSLLLMQDEARFNWSHGIAPRKHDKVDGVLIPRQRRISLALTTTNPSIQVAQLVPKPRVASKFVSRKPSPA